MEKLEIKEEFKKLIPALTQEEFKQLEENCLEEGIREAIITWKGYIIDGHNRYEIANKWNLDFQTKSKHFENEIDVRIWMRNNQKGRRNLTKAWYIELELGNKEDLALKGQQISKEKAVFKGNQYSAPLSQNDNEPKHNTQKEIAKSAGVSTGMVGMSEVIKTKNPELWEKAKAGEVTVTSAYKEIKKEEKKEEIEKRREEIRESLVLYELKATEKKYRIIYADPPWKYGNAMPEYVTEPQDYYCLMSTEDISKMPVKDITEQNAVLFMWTTSPHLPEALDVVKAWGFTYKTTFIWDKIKHNMGHYNSVRHEILLVCTKGACTPDVKKLFDSVQSIERTEHSKKPEQFREIIETLYTFGNRIELFARTAPNGWDVFGNQIN
jgi:N6-adenosine-specific RNA methylase IME4